MRREKQSSFGLQKQQYALTFLTVFRERTMSTDVDMYTLKKKERRIENDN
jgi:hypothetical protein